ncbi:hypothetical protein BC628DRAFT_852288 [Trametes gibbosa]|nr:hypothetical protein BC628DRAFT_852288 [Trametes gibbosa]
MQPQYHQRRLIALVLLHVVDRPLRASHALLPLLSPRYLHRHACPSAPSPRSAAPRQTTTQCVRRTRCKNRTYASTTFISSAPRSACPFSFLNDTSCTTSSYPGHCNHPIALMNPLEESAGRCGTSRGVTLCTRRLPPLVTSAIVGRRHLLDIPNSSGGTDVRTPPGSACLDGRSGMRCAPGPSSAISARSCLPASRRPVEWSEGRVCAIVSVGAGAGAGAAGVGCGNGGSRWRRRSDLSEGWMVKQLSLWGSRVRRGALVGLRCAMLAGMSRIYTLQAVNGQEVEPLGQDSA